MHLGVVGWVEERLGFGRSHGLLPYRGGSNGRAVPLEGVLLVGEASPGSACLWALLFSLTGFFLWRLKLVDGNRPPWPRVHEVSLSTLPGGCDTPARTQPQFRLFLRRLRF